MHREELGYGNCSPNYIRNVSLLNRHGVTGVRTGVRGQPTAGSRARARFSNALSIRRASFPRASFSDALSEELPESELLECPIRGASREHELLSRSFSRGASNAHLPRPPRPCRSCAQASSPLMPKPCPGLLAQASSPRSTLAKAWSLAQASSDLAQVHPPRPGFSRASLVYLRTHQ